MRFTAIQDKSTTTLKILKAHLRIDDANVKHDTYLKKLLAAAKSAADKFINKAYVDIETGADIPIDDDIEQWILMRCASDFNSRESRVMESSITGAATVVLTEEDRYRLQIHKKIFL